MAQSSYGHFLTVMVDYRTRGTDLNGDGVVNIQDIVLIAASFGESGESNADLNGDGEVNVQDLVIVGNALGNAAGAPSVHALYSAGQVEQWLRLAKREGLQHIQNQQHRISFSISQIFMLTQLSDTRQRNGIPRRQCSTFQTFEDINLRVSIRFYWKNELANPRKHDTFSPQAILLPTRNYACIQNSIKTRPEFDRVFVGVFALG